MNRVIIQRIIRTTTESKIQIFRYDLENKTFCTFGLISVLFIPKIMSKSAISKQMDKLNVIIFCLLINSSVIVDNLFVFCMNNKIKFKIRQNAEIPQQM